MPLRDTSGLGQRTARELLHADLEVASNLIEMARSEFERGNRELAAQLLQKAEGMIGEIRGRLQRMPEAQRETYEARCKELGEAIERAGWPGFRISGESET